MRNLLPICYSPGRIYYRTSVRLPLWHRQTGGAVVSATIRNHDRPYPQPVGRKKGQPIRLTTNEWYKAQQLGDSFWLYVVWNPLQNPDPVPVMIQNPAKHLEHAAKPVVSARFYDIPADAIEVASRTKR